MGQFDGKVAIVSGARGAIGRACCMSLSRSGCSVVAVDLESPDEVLAEMTANGGKAEAILADVSDAGDVERAVQHSVERFGQVDILVNCAGVVERKGLADLDVKTFRRTLDVNLLGSLLFIQAVYPHMRGQGHGAIVNISSISGKSGGGSLLQPGGPSRSGAAYAASKGGLDSLTRWVAQEVGCDGIRCNAVCPGPIASDMTAGADYGVDKQPIPRMGQPADVAAAVTYLASDAAKFVTGQSLNIDGGRVMS